MVSEPLRMSFYKVSFKGPSRYTTFSKWMPRVGRRRVEEPYRGHQGLMDVRIRGVYWSVAPAVASNTTWDWEDQSPILYIIFWLFLEAYFRGPSWYRRSWVCFVFLVKTHTLALFLLSWSGGYKINNAVIHFATEYCGFDQIYQFCVSLFVVRPLCGFGTWTKPFFFFFTASVTTDYNGMKVIKRFVRGNRLKTIYCTSHSASIQFREMRNKRLGKSLHESDNASLKEKQNTNWKILEYPWNEDFLCVRDRT